MLWHLMSELFPLILVYSRFLSRFLPFSQTYNLSCSCIDMVINGHYVIIHQLLFFKLVTLFHLNNHYFYLCCLTLTIFSTFGKFVFSLVSHVLWFWTVICFLASASAIGRCLNRDFCCIYHFKWNKSALLDTLQINAYTLKYLGTDFF